MARAAKKTKATQRAKIAVKAGDRVLIGSPGVSMPSDWFFATVLLVEGDEIATVHTCPSTQEPQRQFLPITHVRAVGSYEAMREYQKTCAESVRALRENVDEAGRALVAARDAVWARIDEFTPPSLSTSGAA